MHDFTAFKMTKFQTTLYWKLPVANTIHGGQIIEPVFDVVENIEAKENKRTMMVLYRSPEY